jgi:hypothetical protein
MHANRGGRVRQVVLMDAPVFETVAFLEGYVLRPHALSSSAPRLRLEMQVRILEVQQPIVRVLIGRMPR